MRVRYTCIRTGPPQVYLGLCVEEEEEEQALAQHNNLCVT